VDLGHQLGDAALVAGASLGVLLRRHDRWRKGGRHLSLGRRRQGGGDLLESFLRARSVERGHASNLGEVVEHDHR
jgi:hypothetical protein